MPITAATISDTISRLRSEIAIYDTLVLTLEANYMARDGSMPEQHVEREDGASATDAHLKGVVTDLKDTIEKLRVRLAQWENSTFSSTEDLEEEGDEGDEDSEEEDEEAEDEEPEPAQKEIKRGQPKRPNRNLALTK